MKNKDKQTKIGILEVILRSHDHCDYYVTLLSYQINFVFLQKLYSDRVKIVL